MRTFIAYPPLSRVTGGMAVLARMAAHLAEAGHETLLVPREHSPALLAPLTAEVRGSVPLVPWDDARPERGDIWLAPEGWPSLLLPGLRARSRAVLYVQNWAYLLASLPPEPGLEPGLELGLARLPVRLLAVSQPVAWHAELALGLTSAILRPGIDLGRFHPARPHAGGMDGIAPNEPVRIAWMPRKNKALAGQIRDLFQARQGRTGRAAPVAEWIAIHNKSQDEVADMLRSCHIFLATGFPEGCPLPPLEAMASGCLVAGFGGFGGWDYMRQAWPQGMRPWWPLRPEEESPWAGNGLYAQDADVIAAALALEYAVDLLRRGGAELAGIRTAALATAAAYGNDRHRERLLDLWTQAAAGVALQPFLD
jgi:glycosyltransferase involved in cell wall biosynthesis